MTKKYNKKLYILLMTKFRAQRKYYFSLMINLIIATILNGCVSKIEDNYNNTSSKSTKIALLLPIGSKDRQLSYIAKSLRDAAILASEDLGNKYFEIKTYDTYGKLEEGLIAFNFAVKEKNEIIIGPYLSSITNAITIKFPFNNLKIVSLSNDPTSLGANVFILDDTITNRANNLIEHAINENKYRFALISPIENRSTKVEKMLINKILTNRGNVTFSTHYSEDIGEISDLAGILKQKIKKTNTDVIIFTGDPDKRMSHLAAELADITNSKKESGVQIIGLSNWNNSASIVSENALEGSWFAIPDDRFRKFYENKFIKKFGYKPHPKSNLTYDAIAALGVLEKNFNANSFTYKKFNNLSNSNGFIGIDGIFRFNYDRIAEKELTVIQVKNGKPKVLKKARNRFP